MRWVREAPVGSEAGGPRKKKRSAKPGSNGKAKAGVEESMADLKVDDMEEFERVDEEVD